MWNNSKKITILYAVVSFGLFLIINTPTAFAGNAVLSWDPNSESDLAGYKVYYGTASGDYDTPIDVGAQTNYTVSGLDTGEHYFAVTAYDTSGNESSFSIEVSKTVSTTGGTLPSETLPSGGTLPGESSLGDTMQFTAASGGGGCGLIRPGNGKPSGPEDSAEMMGMITLMLLIVLKKWLKTSVRAEVPPGKLLSA